MVYPSIHFNDPGDNEKRRRWRNLENNIARLAREILQRPYRLFSIVWGTTGPSTAIAVVQSSAIVPNFCTAGHQALNCQPTYNEEESRPSYSTDA